MIIIQRGFTLIELMVTIAILAIVISIAAPNFQTIYRTQKLNAQTKDLMMSLSQARNQALTLRQQVAVNLNSTADNAMNSFNWSPDSSAHLIQGTGKITIHFLANGTVADYNNIQNIIAVCDAKLKKTKRIQIFRTGSVSLLSEGVC